MNQYDAERMLIKKFGISVAKSGYKYLSFASGISRDDAFDATIPYDENNDIDVNKAVLLIEIIASLLPEGTIIGSSDPRTMDIVAGDLK